jgi:hypothetical protein
LERTRTSLADISQNELANSLQHYSSLQSLRLRGIVAPVDEQASEWDHQEQISARILEVSRALKSIIPNLQRFSVVGSKHTGLRGSNFTIFVNLRRKLLVDGGGIEASPQVMFPIIHRE